MTALWSKLVFVADAGLVAWAAWLCVCVAGLGRRGLIEASLGWLLLALAWIAGSGVLLGMVGGLGRSGFLFAHLAGLVVLRSQRSRWREAAGQGCEWLTAWKRLLAGGRPEGLIAVGLGLVFLTLAVLAAQAEPIIYDAFTYRLPRIGAWLQDGWIRHFSTDDPRLNYMPPAPDVVIAWLLGATTNGFYLSPLAQTAGGALLLGATFGLARTVGLTRLSALGAVALVLGMANVAAQFTTIQSDLFTAGVFAASYVLWHRALLRGEGSWVAGVGVALAFGSKGTMFYLAPGAAVWVGWHLWRHRHLWRALAPTAGGFFLATVIFILPGYWRNFATYGSMLGPHEAVVLHHGDSISPAQRAEKLTLNLCTSAVQMFEPNAQPFWLQDLSRTLGEKLASRLPKDPDPFMFLGLSRREQVEEVLHFPKPDADVVTGGLLATACFLGGLAAAVWRRGRNPHAVQVLVWGGGVLGYLLTQHALVQWHHWAFRFMVLAAPWIGVVGAWGIDCYAQRLRVALWTALVLSAGQVFAVVQWQTSQAAWQAVMQPERAAPYETYMRWRVWTGQLDQPAEPLRVAFPPNHPLASFYRLSPPRRVIIEPLSRLPAGTAEEALGSDAGWLVVPLEHFQGREGRVMGRTGLYDLAAYRRLRAGERPVPLLYSHRQSDRGAQWRRELRVRTWSDVPVRLELRNPGDTAWSFVVHTPTGEVSGRLAPGAQQQLDVPVPPDVLASIMIDYPKFSGPTTTPNRLAVKLTQ